MNTLLALKAGNNIVRRDLLVHQFAGSTIDTIRSALEYDGEPVLVRGLKTRELSPAVATYRLGEYPVRDGMARRLGLVEGLFVVVGLWDADLIKWAAPKADMSLFGPMARYGPRVFAQLASAVAELKRDPASRRAVLVLPSRSEPSTPNVPCTLSVQLLVRRGRLDLVVAMRSWDVCYGLPTDLMAFGVLGLVVAWVLGVVPGRLTVTAGSLHAYESTTHLVRGCTLERVSCIIPEGTQRTLAGARVWALQSLKERDLLWLQPLKVETN